MNPNVKRISLNRSTTIKSLQMENATVTNMAKLTKGNVQFLPHFEHLSYNVKVVEGTYEVIIINAKLFKHLI